MAHQLNLCALMMFCRFIVGLTLFAWAYFASADLAYFSIQRVDSYQMLRARSGPICGRVFSPASAMSIRRAQEILGNGPSGRRLGRALTYLSSLQGATQYELIINWERMALLLASQNEDGWDAYRFFGPNGSVGYRGTQSHAIVFTEDGQILKGHIFDEQFTYTQSSAIWNGIGQLERVQLTEPITSSQQPTRQHVLFDLWSRISRSQK